MDDHVVPPQSAVPKAKTVLLAGLLGVTIGVACATRRSAPSSLWTATTQPLSTIGGTQSALTSSLRTPLNAVLSRHQFSQQLAQPRMATDSSTPLPQPMNFQTTTNAAAPSWLNPWVGVMAAGLSVILYAAHSLKQSAPVNQTAEGAVWAMMATTGAVVDTSSTSSWDALQEKVLATPTGAELEKQKELRGVGEGLPHTDCELRLFGRPESEVKVTLYRDMAAWCPYCQKVWMLFEEKQIPYRIQKINMRSYGDKPDWFLKKIPSGLLPVIEIEGQMITESLTIMQLLDEMYPNQGPKMVPPEGPVRDRAQGLLGLERKLFGDWCSLIFRPGGLFGMGDNARKAFEETMRVVDMELGRTPGPWFLGGEDPDLVDLQYVSHIERMLASCLYWKGMKIRRSGKYPNLDAWFDAFELRDSYKATKSDYYTHIRDIPPQYGDGYFDTNDETKAARVYLEGDSWRLPLELNADSPEPLTAPFDHGDEVARLEAAYKICSNHEAVAKFAARGAGEPGKKRFQAPLADPYATPNERLVPEVDALLQRITQTLVEGNAMEVFRSGTPLVQPGTSNQDSKDLIKCMEYLRDRIGSPRDMSFYAAMQFRAHLNEVIIALGGSV